MVLNIELGQKTIIYKVSYTDFKLEEFSNYIILTNPSNALEISICLLSYWEIVDFSQVCGWSCVLTLSWLLSNCL